MTRPAPAPREELTPDTPAVVTFLRLTHAETPAERLVGAAIATYAYPDGTGAYPGLDTIARVAFGEDEHGKPRRSERTVQRAIDGLEARGELLVEYKASPVGTNLYTVLICGDPDIDDGVEAPDPDTRDGVHPDTDDGVGRVTPLRTPSSVTRTPSSVTADPDISARACKSRQLEPSAKANRRSAENHDPDTDDGVGDDAAAAQVDTWLAAIFAEQPDLRDRLTAENALAVYLEGGEEALRRELLRAQLRANGTKGATAIQRAQASAVDDLPELPPPAAAVAA